MDFFSLTPDNVEDYIRENHAFSGMWFFHHVPKTAGSSLVAELGKHASPYINVDVSYEDDGETFSERRDHAVSKFCEQVRQDPPRSASGHVLARHLEQIRNQGRDVRSFTFLRHPVERVLSEYNYCRSELHPPHESFIAQFPTVESFVADESERNKCAQYLLDDLTMSWDEIVQLIRSRYQMIGLQERYPVSFLVMSSLVFDMSLPIEKERVGKRRQAVDPGLARMIAEANEIDLALHDAVKTVYERIALSIWTLQRDKALAV